MEKIVGTQFSPVDYSQKKAVELRNKLQPKEEEEIQEEEIQENPQDEVSPEEEETKEIQEEPQETTEKEIPEEVQPDEEKEEFEKKEKAYLKEIARLKSQKREEKQKIELAELSVSDQEEEKTAVTKAEALVYGAWRTEALEEFIQIHPEYSMNPVLKKRFEYEYSERLPELVFAKRQKIPVTKRFFRERFERVHKAISDNVSLQREEGKKELLRSQSEAAILSASSQKSEQNLEVQKPKRLIPKISNSLDSWITKKVNS